MIAVETAAVAGALIAGPAILRLAHECSAEPARYGGPEVGAVVLLAGVLAAAAAGTGHVALAAPVAMFGTAAAIVDVHERRLPNLLTAALTVVTAMTIVMLSVISEDVEAAVRSVGAAIAVAATATLLKMISPASIGWGDVKLLPPLAAALAWPDPVTLYRGIVAWALLMLVTVALWPIARVDRDETVPYGPALVAGALGALLVVT